MPRFKVDVTELTAVSVTVEAKNADEAEGIVEGYYSDVYKFAAALDGGLHIETAPPEHTVHSPAVEVVE